MNASVLKKLVFWTNKSPSIEYQYFSHFLIVKQCFDCKSIIHINQFPSKSVKIYRNMGALGCTASGTQTLK